MFRLKMADARLWKNLITAISTLIDEASFDITPEGIKLRAMDPSHVAMVDFEWPKNVFDEFVCDKPTKLCINVGEMLKLLKRVSSGEMIELTLDEQTGRLKIILKGNYVRTFSTATLEAVGEEIPTPKIAFNAKVRTTATCLRDAVEDASTISDHIRLEMDKEQFTMKASGDLGSVTIVLDKDSEALLGFEVKEASKATFSLNYLSEIIKAASAISDVVAAEFSTNMPIKLNFELPQQGHLTYFLAPRIEQ